MFRLPNGNRRFGCKECGSKEMNPDFSSEHGFFVAFEWAKKQEWWDEFLFRCWNRFSGDRSHDNFIHEAFIGPRFAEELVKFLRGREK
jgi:hypothetical protein